MRKTLPVVAVLAATAMTLGACNNPNDDAAVNDTLADTAATMPADNTLMDTNVTTNTMVDTNTTVDTNTGVNTTTNTTTNTTY